MAKKHITLAAVTLLELRFHLQYPDTLKGTKLLGKTVDARSGAQKVQGESGIPFCTREQERCTEINDLCQTEKLP